MLDITATRQKKDLATHPRTPRYWIRASIRAAADHFNVPVTCITDPDRVLTRKQAYQRDIAIYVARLRVPKCIPYEKIGAHFEMDGDSAGAANRRVAQKVRKRVHTVLFDVSAVLEAAR